MEKAFEKFKRSEIQRKCGSFENFRRLERHRRYREDPLRSYNESDVAFDRFKFNQVKTENEGFRSIGWNSCDYADHGSMQYVANYALKGYFEMNKWPSRIPVKKWRDGKYHDKHGNIISDEERHKPLRDKYGRLKPSVRHSRGLGKDWALAYADELREKLGIRYTYEHKDSHGQVIMRETRYAPLPRYYKKVLGLKPEDLFSKAKEFMQKDFDEYQKATGRKAIINAATKEDREKQEYILEQFYNIDKYFNQRCNGEREQEAVALFESLKNMFSPYNLEDYIPICDKDLRLPIYSDLFPGQRITADYFAWCK